MAVDNMLTLRCKYCGAPLDRKDVESDSPYVTCPSCGTTQQRVDAQAYLEQLMGQVRSWVNQALPGGFAISQSDSVDSVARYNIFMNSVKPKVDLECGEYRFALNSLISHTMLVIPFTVDKTLKPVHQSAQAFAFGEKLRQIEPLAVDGNSKKVVTSAQRMSDAYALLINNCKLLQENKDGRYLLMVNNFTAAANDFGGIEGYEPAQRRFEALAEVCTGCEQLLKGDVTGSLGHFEAGLAKLKKVSASLLSNLKVGIMMPAVTQEIKQTEVLRGLADLVIHDGTTDPLKALSTIRAIFTYDYPTSGNWGYLLNNRDRFNEIFGYMAACIASRNGGTLNIAAGDGDILVPFWNIELRYSFQTGSLWKKHGVEVSENLLAAADFVTDTACLSNPTEAVTNVFAVRNKEGMFAGITGSETSISSSAGIGPLISSAHPNTAGSRRIVVPLSTKREAERLVEQYVANTAAVENKLKLSNPEVRGLIYVPCRTNNDGISAPAGFGLLAPARMNRMRLSKLVII
ncbi:MAG: hypothetical protein PHE95_05670 [Candidatus Methanomethylophilus sp.]|nr:hypothetical protein [Methanomethylophilus sp.]